MGKNSKQIATKTDVNAKRIGSFATSKECVTKSDLMNLEGITVTNNVINTPLNLLTVGDNSIDNQLCIYQTFAGERFNISTLDTIAVNNSIQFVNSNAFLLSNTSYSNFSVAWSNTTLQGYDSMEEALFYQTASMTAGRHTWTLNLRSIMSLSARKPTYPIAGSVNNCNVSYVLAVFNNANQLIASTDVQRTTTYEFSCTIDFITQSSGAVYFCFIPVNIGFEQNEQTSMTVRNQYCAFGFQMISSSAVTYKSYYDQDYKLVQYDDITRTPFTFNLYYGIWNTKTIKAKLDYVRVYISTSNDTSTGTWTQVGNKSISAVDKTAKGVVSVTIPADVNLGTQYYLKVRCGNTDNEQQWSCRWADCDDIKSYTFPSSKKTTWMDIGPVPLTGLSNSVLNNSSFSGYYGRSATYAACFKID